MKRLLLPTLALSLLLVAAAVAAGWGTGTFRGQVKPMFGHGRGKTPVTVKVLAGKARVKHAGLSFNCTGVEGFPDRRFKTSAESAYANIEPGPAGGGAITQLEGTVTVGGDTYKIDGEAFLGLREDRVLGTLSAYLERGGRVICEDGGGTFTARR